MWGENCSVRKAVFRQAPLFFCDRSHEGARPRRVNPGFRLVDREMGGARCGDTRLIGVRVFCCPFVLGTPVDRRNGSGLFWTLRLVNAVTGVGVGSRDQIVWTTSFLECSR